MDSIYLTPFPQLEFRISENWRKEQGRGRQASNFGGFSVDRGKISENFLPLVFVATKFCVFVLYWPYRNNFRFYKQTIPDKLPLKTLNHECLADVRITFVERDEFLVSPEPTCSWSKCGNFSGSFHFSQSANDRRRFVIRRQTRLIFYDRQSKRTLTGAILASVVTHHFMLCTRDSKYQSVIDQCCRPSTTDLVWFSKLRTFGSRRRTGIRQKCRHKNL
uniref:Uncharacterized protein n=1 Tax=Romanomermis culicivorax TaxID=13658 RepID=A0A915KJD1_ROMCU